MWPFDLVDWLMLSVPIAYLVILVGSLTVFSSLYRKRQQASAAALEPWFPAHLQRNIYLSLLHQDEPKIPDAILKAALLRRATEDIHRIVQIRNAKQALQVLLQRGSVGDDLWQRFQRAEKEIEEELRDVVQEVRSPYTRISSKCAKYDRQMHLHPIGAKPSSNPRLKWRRTRTSASALARSWQSRQRRRSGGSQSAR
jgi:hypothetical protein